MLELFDSLLSDSIFPPEKIKKLSDSYKSSKLIAGRQIWTLITFELWRRMFMEGNVKKPLIDEVQYAPGLFRYLKINVPCKFVKPSGGCGFRKPFLTSFGIDLSPSIPASAVSITIFIGTKSLNSLQM